MKTKKLLFTYLIGIGCTSYLLCVSAIDPQQLQGNGVMAKKAMSCEEDIYKWFKTYSEVTSLVERKAFRNVDFSKFIQESLKSAVSQIDGHSQFHSEDGFKSIMETTSGSFSGIGVHIVGKAPEDDALSIIDVTPNGPAEKAQIQPGDKIMQIDGVAVKGLTTDEVTSKLKGAIGTSVKLQIMRGKKTLDLQPTRDVIKDQVSLCYYFKDQSTYYISLKMFTENAAAQTKQLLLKANEGKCKGIVLDLRHNPGGTLESAIGMAGLFLDKKSLVVVTKDKNANVVERYHTTTDPILKASTPVFVLIDNFTASAAEILAGCLRHYSQQSKKNKLMVFLLGVPTFGKGSVQEVIPISNGCALKLTTMLYYLADDALIQAVGIAPDFTVKQRFILLDDPKVSNEVGMREASLKHHITVQEVEAPDGVCWIKDKDKHKKQYEQKEHVRTYQHLHTKKPADKDAQPTYKTWDERQREALMNDTHVQTSVNMINLFAFAKKTAPERVATREKALQFLKQHFVTDDPVVLEKVGG